MNSLPSQKTVELIRKQYPTGCRVELTHMDDVQAPSIGTKGTVVGVDDTGSIMVRWDNGSSLNVVYGEDSCRKINEAVMDVKVKAQILTVRATGETNMFDVPKVQEIALREGLYELVDFITENKAAYARFILTGDEE